jgi:hypothetical protein
VLSAACAGHISAACSVPGKLCSTSSCQRTHERGEHEGAAFWFLLPATTRRAAQLESVGQGATLRGMGALRSMSVAGLITVLLAGVHLGPSPAAVPPFNLAPKTAPAAVVSTPQESLPAPVHDEATCAFCQAAAFAPHAGQSVGTLTLGTGDEQLVQLAHDDSPAFSASASPARSRAPPILRSV